MTAGWLGDHFVARPRHTVVFAVEQFDEDKSTMNSTKLKRRHGTKGQHCPRVRECEIRAC